MGLTEWLSDSKYLLASTCSYLLLPFWQDFDGLRAACASWSDFEDCGHEADLVGFDDLDEDVSENVLAARRLLLVPPAPGLLAGQPEPGPYLGAGRRAAGRPHGVAQ